MLAAQHHGSSCDRGYLGFQGRHLPLHPHEKRMSKPSKTTPFADFECQGPAPFSQQDVVLSSSVSSNHDATELRDTRLNMESNPGGMGVRIKEEEDTNTLSITEPHQTGSDRGGTSYETSAGHSTTSQPDQSQTRRPLLPHDSLDRIEQPSFPWPASGPRGILEDQLLDLKDEEDDGMEEDEEGEQETTGRPLTAAERSAARRKMKRFRLTHQQTRFLMSEFVKQPHPDAAHRDRLSREIPGLSPRQVQVWFQNRRAKIKRLNAEDRDRVIKMRAVPEDFDNVQALHSPYGAVHGLGPNVASPSQMGPNNQVFGDALQRALMVDIRRPEAEENLSPTGLTPAFESAGFGSVGAGNSTDLASPLSSTPHDRFRQYGGPFSPSLAAITATNQGTLSGSQGRTDLAPLQTNHQGMRPLQPLRLSDTLSRPRADSARSPLRSSASWKNESTDFSSYHFGGGATVTGMERQQPGYHMGSSTSSNAGTFDASSYSGDVHPAASDLSYSDFSTSPNQQRSRAASATFPLSLDLRTQHRGLSNTSPEGNSSKMTAVSTHYTSSSIYTTSYPPAPLTAPINIPQPRSSLTPRGSLSAHSEQQMSASAGATANFSRQSPNHRGASSNTPMKESFGETSFSFGQDDSRTMS